MVAFKCLLLAGQIALGFGYVLEDGAAGGGENVKHTDSSLEEKEFESVEVGATAPFTFIWYIVTFAILVIFFVVMACTDGFCKKHRRDPESSSAAVRRQQESPPDYEQFAPPSYESVVQVHGRSSISKSLNSVEINNNKLYIISENVR